MNLIAELKSLNVEKSELKFHLKNILHISWQGGC